MALQKFDNFKRVMYLLYPFGDPLLTGTDAMNPYCYPGYSLHQELALFKECGIADKEILKMATVTAAEFVHLRDDYGELKTGFKASMVLLNGNPLEDIRQTQNIHRVILNGQVLNQQD